MSKKLSELHLAFSTPIWTSLIENHEELNNKMYKYIKMLQSKDPEGVSKSNMNGCLFRPISL